MSSSCIHLPSNHVVSFFLMAEKNCIFYIYMCLCVCVCVYIYMPHFLNLFISNWASGLFL
jgi:hypothetical protein